ncbi:hypothetical protein L1887_15760 [Cichorium endivia]|nr:hypothetical protein L1887_15760 [Cichorium endivia]
MEISGYDILLKFGVEQVIKDQNMLDVYDMIHGYCHLLIQRINLIEQVNDCPGELKEAVSDLLYAAPRCGEFPELQEIREIMTSRFGKEFANGAIELQRNCGVSQKMIQKVSPGQSSLEYRMKMLTGIAMENGINLQLEKSLPEIKKEKVVEKMENVLSFSAGSMNSDSDSDDSSYENEYFILALAHVYMG